MRWTWTKFCASAFHQKNNVNNCFFFVNSQLIIESSYGGNINHVVQQVSELVNVFLFFILQCWLLMVLYWANTLYNIINRWMSLAGLLFVAVIINFVFILWNIFMKMCCHHVFINKGSQHYMTAACSVSWRIDNHLLKIFLHP